MSMKTLYLSAAVAVVMTGCKPSDGTFELSGRIVGDTTGVVVLIQEGQSRFDALTSPITEGRFHVDGNPLKSPEVFSLIVEKPGQSIWDPSPIFISPGDRIEVDLDPEDFDKSVVRGARLNDEFVKYRRTIKYYGEEELDRLKEERKKASAANDTVALNDIDVRGRALFAELDQAKAGRAYEYIKANHSSFVAAYALYDNRQRLSAAQTDELVGLLDEGLHGSKYVYGVVNKDRNQPGKRADDFTLKDSRGNEVVFSEFARGRVVLLEFWASWCAPCRAANPKLEEIYQKYRGRGFEIVGISQDRDMQTLRQSIEKDGVTFTNLLDVNGYDAVDKLYNTGMLPANVLIDKNGIVVAREINLSELENGIEKLL
jgi:thiol-disulfide isomerase/thioredoxin